MELGDVETDQSTGRQSDMLCPCNKCFWPHVGFLASNPPPKKKTARTARVATGWLEIEGRPSVFGSSGGLLP